MHYLFLDTTNGLTIGLLNRDLNWLAFEKRDEKKPSEVVHTLINEQLIKNNLKINDITLITIAGPGSYTGMRLSEGIAQMFKVCGIKILSLFHFEVPAIVGISSGKWISPAFKGELFIYSWNNGTTNKELVREVGLALPNDFYSNQDFKNNSNVINTTNLIQQNPKKVFEYVLSRNEFFPAYYFRSLEEEFKQND